MSDRLLRLVTDGAIRRQRVAPVDEPTLARAAEIVRDVRERGEPALRSHAESLGDLPHGAPLLLGPPEMRAALDALSAEARRVLESRAAAIRAFAQAQRASVREIEVPIPGGMAGHRIAPVERAGCYAPGGRFPLPSSVLMTAVTARAAGVREVIVASPRPAPVTLAAAAIAGADAFLTVGGAHAIAALAYGAGLVRACDVIAGPGNRWVTAAKKLVSGDVGIDMLAGPSELVVLADDSADPAIVAADLLAQAEHDPDAVPSLVTTSRALVDAVARELARQLGTLPTAPTARAALANGAAYLAPDLDAALRIVDAIAPEHLEVLTRDARAVAGRCAHFGAVFIGPGAAEVFGDYGVGPNHVLPTGGTARFSAGLSVFHFLRIRTFIEAHVADESTIRDTAAFARLEGLEAHARAAECRSGAG